ncbi:hypothetical protein ACOGST_003824 [Vibrio alginolyticus]|uniref:hypothetical protein n=1 Tax=Vibrio sp. ArtGut-C1 TaxID=2259137 RepID=UPI0013DF2527|nr:hypothetical protein [Vibrio sp. ArtGut-C1]
MNKNQIFLCVILSTSLSGCANSDFEMVEGLDVNMDSGEYARVARYHHYDGGFAALNKVNGIETKSFTETLLLPVNTPLELEWRCLAGGVTDTVNVTLSAGKCYDTIGPKRTTFTREHNYIITDKITGKSHTKTTYTHHHIKQSFCTNMGVAPVSCEEKPFNGVKP